MISLLLASLFTFFLITRTEAQPTGAEDPVSKQRTLVIGRVSDNTKKEDKILRPLLDYVVRQLKDLGVTQGSVLLAKDNEQMIRFLKEGRIDWISESVFSSLIYSQETGAEIMLRAVRGSPTYYTVFITRKDGDIHSLENLKGKKIALQDPGSTSAYFVPLAILMHARLKPLELPSPKETAPGDKVGYVFAGAELNISAWVYRGVTDAGAYSNNDWERPDSNPAAMRKELSIFHQGKPLPRLLELARKELDPRIKKRLKEILLKAHEDPAAKGALKSYRGATKFEALTNEAKEQLEEARRMLGNIRQRIK